MSLYLTFSFVQTLDCYTYIMLISFIYLLHYFPDIDIPKYIYFCDRIIIYSIIYNNDRYKTII